MEPSYSKFVLFELPRMTQQDLVDLEHTMYEIYRDLCKTSQTTKTLYIHAQLAAVHSEILIRDCKLSDITSDELHSLQETMVEDIQIQDAVDIVLMRRGIL